MFQFNDNLQDKQNSIQILQSLLNYVESYQTPDKFKICQTFTILISIIFRILEFTDKI